MLATSQRAARKNAQQHDAGEHEEQHAHGRRRDRNAQDALEIGEAVVAAEAGLVAEEQQHRREGHGLRDDGEIDALDARAEGEVAEDERHQRGHGDDEEQGGDETVAKAASARAASSSRGTP